MKKIFNKRAQSTLEYAIIFVAIAGVLAVGVNRALRSQTCQIYQGMGDRMDRSTENMEGKFGAGLAFQAGNGQ